MHIRSKVILIIVSVTLMIIAATYLMSNTIILSSFAEVDNVRASEDMKRVSKAIEDEIDNLNAVNSDWALWDDSYEYMSDRNEDYVQSNLVGGVFENLKLDLIVYTDESGNIVYGQAYDHIKQEPVSPSGDALSMFAGADSPFNGPDSDDGSLKGVIFLDGKPAVVVANPILKSDGEGPARGTLIWARLLDEGVIRQIAANTLVEVKMQPVSNSVPAELASVFPELSQTGKSSEVKDNSLKTYWLLNDVYGRPAVVINTDTPRIIFQHGINSFNFFLIDLFAVSFAYCVVLYYLLGKTIISPLSQLNFAVRAIGQKEHREDRVTVKGNDEIAELGRSINDTLDELDASHGALRQSEQKYATLVERSNDGILIIQDSQVTFANSRMAELIGLPENDLLGRDVIDYISPKYRELVSVNLKRRLAGEVFPDRYEIAILPQTRQTMPVEISAVLIEYGGRPADMLIVRDITERKRAEEQLIASEKRFRMLAENAKDIIYRIRLCPEIRIEYVSPSVTTITGYTPAEILAGSSWDIGNILPVKSEGLTGSNDIFRNSIVIQLPKKDGSLIWMELKNTPVSNEFGKIVAIEGIARDVTENRRMEEALRASEEKYRSLVDNAPIGISVNTPDGKRFEANKAILDLYGYESREEFLNTNVIDVYCDPAEIKGLLSLVERGPARNLEMRRKRKDGSMFWALLTSIPYTSPSGEKLVINVIQDITARKQLDDALRDSEQRYRSLIDDLPVGIGIVTPDGKAIQRNKALLDIYGYKTNAEANNLPITTHYYDLEDRKRFLKLIEKGPVKNYQVRLKRKDGTVFWSLLNSIAQETPSGERELLTVIQDIDDKMKTEEQNRLEAELLDAVTDIVYVFDEYGDFVYANEAFCKTYGYNKDELKQLNLSNIVLQKRAPFIKERIQETTYKNGINRFESVHISKDGISIPVEVYSHLVNLGEGNLILSVARDITERKKAEIELKESYERLSRAMEEMIKVLAAMVGTRDPYTAGHQRRVTQLAQELGRKMALPEDKRYGLKLAATIHDIGKIAIPSEILSKPGQLSPIEISLVKTHAAAGYDIVKDIEFTWPIAQIILQHHERINGSGYPLGLKDGQILTEAKILGVADVVEAISSHRPYRAALGLEAALDEIVLNRGILYDPDVVDACVKLFREEGFKFEA